MKKLLALIFLLVACVTAQAADQYFCSCDTGKATGCVAGDDTTGDGTINNPYATFSKYITNWKAWNQNGVFYHCRGGAWNSASQTVASGGNLNNANATKDNPIVTDSYDATGHTWTGGAGIKPLWINSGSTTVLDISQGTVNAARNGYTWKNIDIEGSDTHTGQLVNVGSSHNYITFDGMTVAHNAGGAIQCTGGVTSAPAGGDSVALSEHFTVRNSTISNNTGIGILTSCNDTLIEGNTFDKNGTAVFDHHIYITGENKARAVPTLSSVVGDGTTVTVTTTGNHNIWSGVPTTKQTAATITSGSSNFGITVFAAGSAITYVSPTSFTYAQTGSGTASTPAITAVRQVVTGTQAVVRGNTLTNANVGAAGSCGEAALVVHGEWQNIRVENNLFREDTVPTNGSCAGIEFDDGGYLPPEQNNAMNSYVIANNTVLNYATGIGVDLSARVLIENNYENSGFTGDGIGINHRIKNNTPAAAYSGTATAATATTLSDSGKSFSGLTANRSIVKITGGTGSGQRATIASFTSTQLTVTPAWSVTPDTSSTYVVTVQSGVPVNGLDPDQVTIRYNTVYRTSPNLNSAGIALNANVTDNLSGRNFALYANDVTMGSTATTATRCFSTENMSASWFTTKDYNSCYYLGAAVPKWENASTLATIQGATCPASAVNDCNSTFAATADVTTGQPFFTSPTTSPATGASSALIGAGHPTLKPATAWGGVARSGTQDRGAYQRGASTVVPNSQTRMCASATACP